MTKAHNKIQNLNKYKNKKLIQNVNLFTIQ